MGKDPRSPAVASPYRARRVDRLERKNHSLHRSVLDKSVLQGLMPIRARTTAHRSAQPEARARWERFLRSSPAYEHALPDSPDLQHHARRIELDSLTWWAPIARPDDPVLVERALRHQNFPYRLLTQTRDVAIGGLMIDIGANVGRMSIPRVVLGDIVAAYCAEPDPLNYQCLARNVRDNNLEGLVLPDRVAIGASDGTVRLMRSKTAGGHRVLDAGVKTEYDVVEVESLALDTWTERAGIDLERLVFIKLDAQGSEVHVLRGAARVLGLRHVAWQIEIDLALLARRGLAAEDLYGLLRQHFSHFIDLNREVAGERVRAIADLSPALAYLGDGRDVRTDVMVFTLESGAAH